MAKLTPKEKALELIELHKILSLGNSISYSLTFCDAVLKNNPSLNDEKRAFWNDVIIELEKLN